jgi:hypothetical protein
MFCHSSWRIFAPRIIIGLRQLINSLAMAFPTILLLNAVPLTAQVEWKDRYVTIAANDQQHQSIARPVKDDYTVVVWESANGMGATDIYAQKIENNHGIALWQPDGVVVCSAEGDQTNPRAAYDSLGGIIITWEDARNVQNGGGIEIYAQRILFTTGDIDPAWGNTYPDGLPICTGNTQDALRPRIVGTGEGAFIAWVDYRNVSSNQNTDIYLQYILSATASWPGGNWASNGIKVPVDIRNENQRNHEIALDNYWRNYGVDIDRLGVVVTYESDSLVVGGAPDAVIRHVWNVYADAFDRAGNLVWGDLRVDPTNFDQYTPQIVSIGWHNTGYVIVWEDHRDSSDANLYSQLVARNGSRAWQASLQVCNNGGHQTTPRTVLIEDSLSDPYVVVAWQDNAMSNTDIYANRIDVLGYAVHSPSGTLICNADDNQWLGMADMYRATLINHAVIVWEDHRRSPKSEIYYQDISVSSWQLELPANGRAITLAQRNKSNPEAGGMVFVWTDARRVSIPFDPQSDLNIYTEKIGESCDGPTEMHWKDVFARWSLSSSIHSFRWAIDDTSLYAFVAWEETRTINASGDTVHAIFVQKLDRYGVPRWANNGVQISASDVTASNPDVCYDGEGGAYVVWQHMDAAVGTSLITYRRVASDGTPAWAAREILDLNWDPVPNGHDARLAAAFTDGSITYMHDAWCVFIGDPGNHTRYICRVLPNGGLNPFADAFNCLEPRSTPVITTDRLGGAYFLTQGGGNIYAEHVGGDYFIRRWVSKQMIPAVYPPDDICFGYDIAADPVFSAPGGSLDRPVYPYDAVIAYAESTGPRSEVKAIRFFNDPAWTWNVRDYALYGIVDLSATNTLNAGNAKYPSIDCDLYDSNGDFTGGAIVAWDNEIASNDHQAVTNSAHWDYDDQNHVFTGSGSGWPATAPLVLDGGINATTFPKVAFWDSRTSQDPFSLGGIVWANGEASCGTSPSSVLSQLVDYIRPTANAALWSSNQVVSPGVYFDEQKIPDIQSSFRYPRHVWVFWSDSRTGLDCISGTYTLDGGNALELGKENRCSWMNPRSATQSISLEQNYPNPVSLSSSSNTEIRFTLTTPGYVELSVFDVLGRRIATLVDDARTTGSYIVPFPVRNLQPGMYIYSLSVDGLVQSRSLVVIR